MTNRRLILNEQGNFICSMQVVQNAIKQRGIAMPEICRFLGIIIVMYYKEHQPPHFHAKYGDQVGVFSIPDLKLIEGLLPKRVISLVLEWAFGRLGACHGEKATTQDSTLGIGGIICIL